MITIILTYRNRTESIIKKCFESLNQQSNKNFFVKLINYGSSDINSSKLSRLTTYYSFIELIIVPTEHQLWNKSRAINIALKKCETPYFFVGDIDMIYRKDFVEQLYNLKGENKITYFQVGFLSKKESLKELKFEAYQLKHISRKEATGMTLYPTKLLKEINGYDEFYHGWGAEDSDVHMRIKNYGKKIIFYTIDVLILHQYHERNYRTDNSLEPFHTRLEQINHAYFKKVIELNKIKVNTSFGWGINQIKVEFGDAIKIYLTNEKNEIDAFFRGMLLECKGQKLDIYISKNKQFKSFKNRVKKNFGKKFKEFYSFKELNNLILMLIVSVHRNSYYEYDWDKEIDSIKLKIELK